MELPSGRSLFLQLHFVWHMHRFDAGLLLKEAPDCGVYIDKTK